MTCVFICVLCRIMQLQGKCLLLAKKQKLEKEQTNAPKKYVCTYIKAALTTIYVCSCKHNSSWVVTSMHTQMKHISSKSARFNPYFCWFVCFYLCLPKYRLNLVDLLDHVSFIHVCLLQEDYK